MVQSVRTRSIGLNKPKKQPQLRSNSAQKSVQIGADSENRTTEDSSVVDSRPCPALQKDACLMLVYFQKSMV